MIRRCGAAVALAALCAMGGAGCASGPVGKTELCAGFDQVDQQFLRGNTGIGNPLFTAVDELADLADRYPGGAVAADAARLHAVGDDDSTDSNELRNATIKISALCDRPPIGLGFLVGR
jgi:hypothetical protein